MLKPQETDTFLRKQFYCCQTHWNTQGLVAQKVGLIAQEVETDQPDTQKEKATKRLRR